MFVFNATTQTALCQERPKIYLPLLSAMQSLVGGNVEAVPCPFDFPYTAYANAAGRDVGLPINRLAFRILQQLGFEDSTQGLGYYHGNIVLLGRGLRVLTTEQIQTIEGFIVQWNQNKTIKA